MEDEGGLADHLSGISATDGRWHHIAVTWRSSDGQTKLYDNGVEVGRRWSAPMILIHLNVSVARMSMAQRLVC